MLLAAVGPQGRSALFSGVLTAVAIAWLAVGVWFVQLAFRGRQGMWSGCAMLLIAGQAVLRVLCVYAPETWMFPAATLMLVAAGAGLAGSGKGLLAVLRHQDRNLLRLSVDLQASEDQIAGERDRRQEQLHDVRSALAGIRCANGTLHRYAERLDERTKATLEDALTKELGRLEGLVDPTISHPMTDFGLQELLGPLIATESSLGKRDPAARRRRRRARPPGRHGRGRAEPARERPPVRPRQRHHRPRDAARRQGRAARGRQRPGHSGA